MNSPVPAALSSAEVRQALTTIRVSTAQRTIVLFSLQA